MKTSAMLSVTYKKDGNFIYQTIRITPSRKSFLRYFTQSKYNIAKEVDDLLSTIYIGDGEKIFFRSKERFRNQITIKYEYETENILELTEKSYHIQGDVPQNDGCIFCTHLNQPKRGKSKCMFYKEFLDRMKIWCTDFQEKE